jgi:hypothetical protein
MYTKIAPIVLNSDKKNNGAVKIFIAEPDSLQEKLAGRLFVLLEVTARRQEAEKICNFIITNINENYYQNEKIALREKIAGLRLENIFETILVKTNRDLIDFLTREKIQIRPTDINATIGIIHEDQLHFSNTGKNKPLLLHKENSDDDYKIINIERDDEVDFQEISLKKLFSSIVSGEMPQKSYFIFTNETLAEYLYNQEMIDIITKLAPLGAAEQIKNTLFKINPYIPFLGLIIKNGNNENYERPDYQSLDNNHATHYQTTTSRAATNVEDPFASLTLSSLENKTEQILAPVGIVDSKKISRGFFSFLKKINPFRLLFKLITLIFRRKNRPSPNGVAPTSIDRTLLNEPGKKRHYFGKIIFIILILAVVAFGASLFFKRTENKKVEVQEQVKNNQEIIEQKINEIEAYLLYSDENSAKKILTELKDIIDKLSDDDKKNINNYQQLADKYQGLSDKLNHVAKIEDLKETYNFSNLNPDAIIDNIKISSPNGKDKEIYAVANNKKTIYKVNLKDNITSLINSDKIIGALNFPLTNKDQSIYYLDQKQIVRLDPKNSQLGFFKLNLNDNQVPLGISIYNDKLYLLDKTSNQLYRYALTNNAYEKAEPRLKDKLDTATVVSFAIDTTGKDSNVFILKSSGEVLKFYDGKQQLNFKLATPEPVLKNAKKISVLNNIYISEPESKRLLIFDKSGKFIKQFQSDQLNDIKDFTVDEAGGKIYVLNGNTVYEMGL